MTLTPGTRLDGYKILGPLGAGGMGEVYRALDSVLKREVAIKVLPSFVSRDPDRLRRFEQEAQAAAALNHPNILAVHQVGTYEGAPYLVSELLDGATLGQQLARGPLPVRRAIDYGIQLAHGLAAAHKKGIVHRDLKPENVFVTKDGRVKLLDFGLAKLTQTTAATVDDPTVTLQGQTEPGVVLGTVGYMSPEQVRGNPADHRADIFAFGAILYEMLAGKRAFRKQTSAETMTAILNEDPPGVSQIVPSAPPGLVRAVHRCLEKNPEQRFQSASDLAFALEALSESSTFPDRLKDDTKTRAIWVWMAPAAVVAGAVAVFFMWWRLPSAVPEVEAVTQLTDDGEPKQGRIVSDGVRVYFNEGETGSWKIAQVSVSGGQTALVSTRLVNPQVAGLAPDNSSLLALVGGFNDPVEPLWSIPLPAGEPRRLGNLEAQDANFFPNGRIAFTHGTAVSVAEKDGSSPRELIELGPRLPWSPSVSPDGKRLGFTASFLGSSSLRELAIEGNTLREVLTDDPQLPLPCCATWTPDGKYLLFHSRTNGRWDIWALPEKTGLLRRSPASVRLTNGPLSYSDATPSHDGKQIFAVGSKPRGELIRYDERSHQFVPFLSGISATDPSFSRDGKWVAYRSYPDYSLWRSRSDGSERLQLTYPPTVVWLPVISPDGRKVVFGTSDYVVHIVDIQSGASREIADKSIGATWSPDGNELAITSLVSGKPGFNELRVFDMQSGRTSIVPNSKDMIGAFWVNQQTLVASTQDTTKFLMLDLTSGKLTNLAAGVFVNWFISGDNKYLLATTGGEEPKALRIRFFDHRIETIVGLKGLRRVVDPYFGTQVGVAPDGSVLLTRDVGTQEIYALNVRWP